MHITSGNSLNRHQKIHFQGEPSNGSALKALEDKLRLLMNDVPQDQFSSNRNEIVLTPQAEKVKQPTANLTNAMPQGFLPLSAEAARVIPPIARQSESAPDSGQVIAEQLQTLIDLKMTQIPQNTVSQSTQAKQFEQHQRIAETRKETDKHYQTARQKIALLSLNTAALATFSAAMLATPLAPVGAAMLLSTKITLFTSLLTYASSLFGTMTDLMNNKQTKRAVKSLVSDAIGGIKRLFGFGGKKSIRFAGSEAQQANTVTATKTLEGYQQRLIQAGEKFNQAIDSATTETEKTQLAQTFQREILVATQTAILENGTEADKARILKIQRFQAANDVLCAAFSRPDQELVELPPEAQNHLRQMIFETLTSGVPELQDWGKAQAQAIGILPQRINRLITRSV
jgi:hypothetical protein